MSTLAFDPIAEARRQWDAHGWEEASLGMSAVTSIVRAHQIVIRRVNEVLADFELTLARFEVLRLLRFTTHGELPLGKISARLQVQAGSVTSAVDRLERDDLVERRVHDSDGRVTLAALTPLGQHTVDEATPAVNAVFIDLGLDESQLEHLVALLTTFRATNGD